MSRGRVNQVRIKGDQKDDIRSFSNVKLELLNEGSSSVLVMTISPGEEMELDLKHCTYMDDSSIEGKVISIRDNRDKQVVTIMDRNQDCLDLLNNVCERLRSKGGRGEQPGKRQDRKRTPSPRRQRSPSPRRQRSPSPRRQRSPSPRRQRSPSPRRPIDNEKVNKLLKALNEGNANSASDFARDLARSREPIRFALDMINESGNAAPRPPPEPVQIPIKLKLSIESFLAEINDQKYDVTVLPGTTVKDLKDIIQQDAGVAPDHQFWYIDRNHLSDDYRFGVSRTPSVKDGTQLILYIVKPQNT